MRVQGHQLAGTADATGRACPKGSWTSERSYMRRTLIALAVGGIASVAYAGSNMQIGRFGAPIGEITGQTESGPVHSFMGPQVSAVYPSPQMYNEGTAVTQPVVVGAAS